jgi:hypothetical protein
MAKWQSCGLMGPKDMTQWMRSRLKKAFSVYAYPDLHRKMVALFKELAQQAGLLARDTEQEPPTIDALPTEEGRTARAESPELSQMHEPVPMSDDARAEELGEFLTRLFQLPKSLGWTEENRVWWRQAVAFNAEQIVQALTGQEATKR